MSRIPLPPGFNDLARELEAHRRSLSRRPPAKDYHPLFVRVAVVLSGIAIGVIVALATDQTMTRAAFANGVTVEATVTGVDHGEPVVRFTTGEGVEITTIARGGHTLEDPLERTVLHLPGVPEQAVTIDHEWPWWPWLVPVALFLALVVVLWNRGGVRAGWFLRRVRVLRWGPPGRGAPWRHVLPWATGAVSLVAIGIGLYLLPLLSNTYVPSELFGVGAALVVYGLGLAVQALYRYAEHAPLHRAPRVFRPLPRGVVALPGLILFAAASLTPLFSIALSAAESDGPREHGNAEIIAHDCLWYSKSCVYRITVEYEAGGLTYRDSLDARPKGQAEELVRAAQAPVGWALEDPTDLRGEW